MARNALMGGGGAGVGNALTGRPLPTPQEQDPGGDEDEFWGLAQKAGYQGNDMQEAMRAVWKMMPTDGVGELIDGMARRYGVQPPWGGPQGPSQPMPEGAVYPEQAPPPQQPAGDMMRGRR